MPRSQNSALEALKRLHVPPAEPGVGGDRPDTRRPGAPRRPGDAGRGDRGHERQGGDRQPRGWSRQEDSRGPERPRRPGPPRGMPAGIAAPIDPVLARDPVVPVGAGLRGAPYRPIPPMAPGLDRVPPPRGRVGAADAEEVDEGVEANARLTGGTAAVLLVLFAIEGLTVLRIRSLVVPHVIVGMLLIPPVLLKMGSTSWRFARYYMGSPAYRRKGAPPPTLRLLGPVVVVLTVVLLASGVALLLAPVHDRLLLLHVHQVSFVLWFIVMVVHVLGHILETAQLAPRDWVGRTRRQVRGAGARQWAIASALALGLILAVMVAPKAGPWFAATFLSHH